MNRDGNKVSIWQDGVPAFQPKNSWKKDTVYDVLIVGGGITGVTAAYLLQAEGKQCVLAEAANIGFGTTGGTTAHLNTVLDNPYNVIEKNFSEDVAQQIASAAREAIDLIDGLCTKHNIDADFTYEPCYLFSTNEEETKELEKVVDATKRAGVVGDWSEQITVPIPFEKAARFEFQARFHPTKYITGLAKAYDDAGGVLLQQCSVSSEQKEEDYHIIETSLGTIKAKAIIYATHIPPGLNILHFRCAPYRSYAQAFTLKGGKYPEGLIYDMKEPYNYYRTHNINGQDYLIAGGYDHKTGHHENTEAIFTEQEAYYRQFFDIDTVAYRWSSQYFSTTDGLPYIGLLPGHDDIFVGTGYDGNGLIFGTLAAKIICEILTKGESKLEKILSPSRVKPIAGFTDFIKENADVVSQFIGKRFQFEQINALAELAPGDATLAEWEGKKVAMYKDEAGKLFALDPVCPHAQCIVAWNNAEKSWDCPCHGARYAPNGTLLTGPARHGLTPIVWDNPFSGE